MRWTWLFLLAACQSAPEAPTRAELVAAAENAEARTDWRVASERWQRLYESSPDSVACRGLARVLRGQAEYAAALRVLLSCAEPDAALLMERAHWFEEAGNRDAAWADLEEVYATWPEQAHIRQQLASMRLAEGDVQGALTLSRERVGRNPNDPDAWSVFARMARRAGAEEEERGAYLQLIRLGGIDGPKLRRLAELTLSLGHDPAMIDMLLATDLDSDPSDAEGWLLLARVRATLGDEAGRAEALGFALEADPGNQETLVALVQALIEEQAWERVRVLAEHARVIGAHDLANIWLAAIPDEPEEGDCEEEPDAPEEER